MTGRSMFVCLSVCLSIFSLCHVLIYGMGCVGSAHYLIRVVACLCVMCREMARKRRATAMAEERYKAIAERYV